MLLDGVHDKSNAIVAVHAGSGGTEAQDWAEMLLRMLLRYCEKKGWNTTILDESKGTEAGIKSTVFRVEGRYAYGHLKSENGTHRLVRISPFDAEKMRHTSFALVEVIPEIENSEEIIKARVGALLYLKSPEAKQLVDYLWKYRTGNITDEEAISYLSEFQVASETAKEMLARMKNIEPPSYSAELGAHKNIPFGDITEIKRDTITDHVIFGGVDTGIEDASVSKYQATIYTGYKGEKGYFIIDDVSKNGTRVNKRLIKGPVLLSEGDVVEMGDVFSFKVSKAEDIDFPEQNFDVVYSITVLQHIPTQEKLEQAVYKIVHAVKKEGYICILEKAPKQPIDSQVDHISIRAKQEWIDLFNKHNAVLIKEKALPQVGYALLKWYDAAISFFLSKFAKKTLENSKQEKKEYLATNQKKSIKMRLYNIGKKIILFVSYPIDHLLIYIPIYNKSITRFLLFKRRQ